MERRLYHLDVHTLSPIIGLIGGDDLARLLLSGDHTMRYKLHRLGSLNLRPPLSPGAFPLLLRLISHSSPLHQLIIKPKYVCFDANLPLLPLSAIRMHASSLNTLTLARIILHNDLPADDDLVLANLTNLSIRAPYTKDGLERILMTPTVVSLKLSSAIDEFISNPFLPTHPSLTELSFSTIAVNYPQSFRLPSHLIKFQTCINARADAPFNHASADSALNLAGALRAHPLALLEVWIDCIDLPTPAPSTVASSLSSYIREWCIEFPPSYAEAPSNEMVAHWITSSSGYVFVQFECFPSTNTTTLGGDMFSKARCYGRKYFTSRLNTAAPDVFGRRLSHLILEMNEAPSNATFFLSLSTERLSGEAYHHREAYTEIRWRSLALPVSDSTTHMRVIKRTWIPIDFFLRNPTPNLHTLCLEKSVCLFDTGVLALPPSLTSLTVHIDTGPTSTWNEIGGHVDFSLPNLRVLKMTLLDSDYCDYRRFFSWEGMPKLEHVMIHLDKIGHRRELEDNIAGSADWKIKYWPPSLRIMELSLGFMDTAKPKWKFKSALARLVFSRMPVFSVFGSLADLPTSLQQLRIHSLRPIDTSLFFLASGEPVNPSLRVTYNGFNLRELNRPLPLLQWTRILLVRGFSILELIVAMCVVWYISH